MYLGFFFFFNHLWLEIGLFVCVCEIINYLFRRNLNGDATFHNTERNRKLLCQQSTSKKYVQIKVTVRMLSEMYIFYSLISEHVCFSFSNLVKIFLSPAKIVFFLYCSKTNILQSCQSYFSEVCQKSKCLCT